MRRTTNNAMTSRAWSIQTDWEEIEKAFNDICSTNNDGDEVNNEDTVNNGEAVFVSRIRLHGRPLSLPPLMTPEKRMECREYRSEAIRRENNRVSMNESYNGNKEESSDSSDSSQCTVEASRRDDSTNNFVRKRSDSYTLDEPSPVLRAYYNKYGHAGPQTTKDDPKISTNSISGTVAVESKVLEEKKKTRSSTLAQTLTPEEKRERLETFLKSVQQSMPSLKRKTRKVRHQRETLTNVSLEAENVSDKESQLKDDNREMNQNNEPIPDDDEDTDTLLSNTNNHVSHIGHQESTKETFGEEKAEDNSSIELKKETSNSETNANKVDSRPLNTAPNGGRQEPIDVEKKETDSMTEITQPLEKCEEQEISPLPSLSLPTLSLATSKSSTLQLEQAVSTLAQTQHLRVRQLLEAQAKQRERLRAQFEEQQRLLIQKIVLSMGGNGGEKCDSESLMAKISASKEELTGSLEKRAEQREAETETTETASKKGPEFGPDLHRKFCKLSALAKGFLTRRLLRTLKVESLITSIKDTTSTALQLHRDADKGVIQKEDFDLHTRLVQQLNKDYNQVHEIFFVMSTQQRMAIIAMDHDMRLNLERRRSSVEQQQPQLSRVTVQRLAQRQQVLNALNHEGVNDDTTMSSNITVSAALQRRRRMRRSGSERPARNARRSLHNSAQVASSRNRNRAATVTATNGTALKRRPWR